MKKLGREELINLIKKIVECDENEENIDNMIRELEDNVLYPNVSDLIFWDDKSPEEIVDIAMNYKGIDL